jgi:hypothetical protein
VSDPQDAGIPGARVTITNVDTGVATRLTTNDKGSYAAPLLLPGTYQIVAAHEGSSAHRATQSN